MSWKTSSPAQAGGGSRKVVVSGLASDSHTWNLVYLQLLVAELGYAPVNLGPCVPDDLLVSECEQLGPALIVLSSVNGHGYQDGSRVIRLLRRSAALARTPVVVGGKLGTDGTDTVRADELVEAGFDAVFEDGAQPVTSFLEFVESLPQDARVG